MNKFAYLIVTTFIPLTFGCNGSAGHLSVSTMDSNSELIFKADYPEEKTGKLEKYLDSALHNDLPLDQNIDLFVNLNGTDKFNLKATSGHLEIVFNKKGNSQGSYLKIKHLTENISNTLTEN